MKAAQRYLKLMKEWNGIAERNHFADNRCDDSALAIDKYLEECVDLDLTPTFKGFMVFLSQFAPEEPV